MPEGLPDINLLPKYERQSSKSFIIFIILIIIMIILFLFFGASYFITKSKLHSVETTYNELSKEVDELHEELKMVDEDESSSFDEAVLFVENHAIPTSIFITELDDLLPDYSYLSEYQYANQEAEVIAHFETLDTVAAYTTELTTSPYVHDTKVDVIETFLIKEEMADEDKGEFDSIPRYETEFTLKINKQKLKGAASEDE